jgi:hypothetical protein
MPLVGFEPTIPASEWSQTYALDRAITGTGYECTLDTQKIVWFCSSMFQSHFRHILGELNQKQKVTKVQYVTKLSHSILQRANHKIFLISDQDYTDI